MLIDARAPLPSRRLPSRRRGMHSRVGGTARRLVERLRPAFFAWVPARGR
jgi:hypothetical protein